ncbi:DNA-3-methyladenine glycosylase [Colwellia sp. PAMC 20917]|jgi:DNA-3-methyladenine glycosylase I|uniref:DNA-3-methyladenine glycosylase I n=1 Tax=unclassified Colwellia TaxID=196834 RepID=UPI0008782C50|nr:MULTISPECIES: DNA-3-methyladenine glycosylase I [unclassified Colwellia]MBA6365347.1 DNA-3-methyladenine glycosylase I [Colwellia sp. BRX8-8]AOW75558.1 DNA-3-methyladenine glycosylase [Colwellia sp. PAMC 20917]MBA6338314.1 DNA-3-methyladenine glycosylase I [Colwellia sp. BRX8-7]MBA6346665.1 DNA-3-methyladenine glycosylase I [Colwellia sp. BRX8-9]MBA6353482.1 DNA-3-methyladenine glycosylase I [Colwellia sp. BRX9-1]
MGNNNFSVNKCRCSWLDTSKPDYVKYHDEEWGVPVHDDKVMFESLVLESAQAGLSWYTILKKREGYRTLFLDFDVNKVARFTNDDVERLMQDASIVRNRLKIVAAINNAQRFIEIQQEYGSFCQFIWSYVDNKTQVNSINDTEKSVATSPISDRLAKDMKKIGFKFLGSTTLYSHLQATGLINDHSNSCFRK